MIYYVSQTETIQEENSIHKGDLELLVTSNFMTINNSLSATLFPNFAWNCMFGNVQLISREDTPETPKVNLSLLGKSGFA